MKKMLVVLGSMILAVAIAMPIMAQGAKPVAKILITNTRVFDGEHEKLAEGMSVLVEGNKIAKIAKFIKVPKDANVIDAKGKVLMPVPSGVNWHVRINA